MAVLAARGQPVSIEKTNQAMFHVAGSEYGRRLQGEPFLSPSAVLDLNFLGGAHVQSRFEVSE